MERIRSSWQRSGLIALAGVMLAGVFLAIVWRLGVGRSSDQEPGLPVTEPFSHAEARSKSVRPGWKARTKAAASHPLELHLRAWEVENSSLEAFREENPDPFGGDPFSSKIRAALSDEGVVFGAETWLKFRSQGGARGYVIVRHTRENMASVDSFLTAFAQARPINLRRDLFQPTGWRPEPFDPREPEVYKALALILDDVLIENGTTFGKVLETLEDQIADVIGEGDFEHISRLELRIAEVPGEDFGSLPFNNPYRATVALELKGVPVDTVLQYLTDKRKIRYRVDGSGVTFLPLGSPEPLATHYWQVSPRLMSSLLEGGRASFYPPDPFADEPLASASGKLPLVDVFRNNGISFLDGASVSYLPERELLVVRNSRPNLDLLVQLLTELMIQESILDAGS